MYDIRTMRKLTHRELVEQRLSAEQAATVDRFPLTVVLDDIRSLYNVGCIFRSADAFRVQQLVLTGFTPTPPRKEISKTALGADETVPWIYVPTAEEAVTQLKEKGAKVLALELTNDASPIASIGNRELGTGNSKPGTWHLAPGTWHLAPGTWHLALVLGNELTGVKQSVLDLCDGAVMIPMYGVKHSLNVAVAAGIAMYEAVRGLA
jgi:tRNA G18 (ribose-2'-O)-methylase SpoU